MKTQLMHGTLVWVPARIAGLVSRPADMVAH